MSNLFKEFKEMPMSLKRLEHASLLNVSKKHTSDTSVLNLPPPKKKNVSNNQLDDVQGDILRC